MLTRLTTFTILMLIAPRALPADEPKKITGRVVDQVGIPVAGASVSAFWAANGLNWDQVVAVRDKEPEKLWQNEGRMEPWGEVRVVTDAGGRFSIPAPERKKTLMIYDRERRHGAILVFDPKHPEVPVEVHLSPLVRIFGTNRLSGMEGPLKWTCTYLNLPYDERDPLNRGRMAICGSFQVRFEFLVPPGTYDLSASSDSPSSATLEDRKITVTADQKEVDLGGLVLRPQVGGVQKLIDRAKAKGTWGDYKQNFGKQPPPWHLTDAKGIAKDAKLSDFKGKWTVLYFWGPNCSPCLGKELPKLMEFYEEHKAQRNRFEILAFCCDFSESLKDIPALERQLEHVKKAAWGGKDLPFPVLLDNTFQTYERFGLEGNGVSNTLLIDPEGKLVEGDLKALEKKLDLLDKNSP
jgi:alkyl hydroperoxide reductase subunit AhpC